MYMFINIYIYIYLNLFIYLFLKNLVNSVTFISTDRVRWILRTRQVNLPGFPLSLAVGTGVNTGEARSTSARSARSLWDS